MVVPVAIVHSKSVCARFLSADLEKSFAFCGLVSRLKKRDWFECASYVLKVLWRTLPEGAKILNEIEAALSSADSKKPPRMRTGALPTSWWKCSESPLPSLNVTILNEEDLRGDLHNEATSNSGLHVRHKVSHHALPLSGQRFTAATLLTFCPVGGCVFVEHLHVVLHPSETK